MPGQPGLGFFLRTKAALLSLLLTRVPTVLLMVESYNFGTVLLSMVMCYA